VSSVVYNYVNEYFQYGNINNADHGLFWADALLDTTLSLFYSNYARKITNAIRASVFSGLIDGAIDVSQTMFLATVNKVSPRFKTPYVQRVMVDPEPTSWTPIKPIYI
jgi:hypothetical protein